MLNVMPAERQAMSGLVSAKLVLDLLCCMAAPFLLFYGAKSYLSGFEFYAASLMTFAVLITSSFVIYKFFGHWKLHRNFLVWLFTVFYFYLLITGGESGSGIFWLYAYPLLMFSVLGMNPGKLIMSAIISATACILFIPGFTGPEPIYSMNTKLRFFGSMCFVSMMAFIMERARVSAAIAHHRVSAALEDLARTDELTALLNRRGMTERIETELMRSVRDGQEMSVVICDVDFFKKINDQFGHDVGDQVLVQLADQLRYTVRGSDSVARWGGEEFIILLPNTGLEKAYRLIERIRESIAARPYEFGHCSVDVSISCGLASTKFPTEMNGLLKAADLSLYEAKAGGRNCTRPVVLKAS